MALSDNVKIGLKIEVAQSSKDVDALNKALKTLKGALDDTTKSSEDLNSIQSAVDKGSKEYAKTVLEQALNHAENATKIREMNKALKELSAAQQFVTNGTPEYKKLSKAINETKEKVTLLNKGMVTLQGTGSERLQASFKVLTESLGEGNWKGAKVGLQGIGSAMSALPIFLLVEGVKMLIDRFDEVADFAKSFTSEAKEQEKTLRELNQAFNEIGNSLTEIDFLEQKFLKNSEQQIKIETEKAKQKGASQKSLDKIEIKGNEQKLKILKKAEDNYNNQLLYAQGQYNKALGGEDDEALKNAKDILAKTQDAHKKTIEEIANLEREGELDIEKRKTESIKKRDADRKKEAEDKKKALDETRQLSIDAIKDDQKREEEKAIFDASKRQDSIDASKASQKDKSDFALANELALNKSLSDIQAKFEDQRKKLQETNDKKAADDLKKANESAIKDKLAVLNSQRDLELAQLGNKEDEKLKLTQSYLEQEKALRIQLAAETGENIDVINKDFAAKSIDIDTKLNEQLKKNNEDLIKKREELEQQSFAASSALADAVLSYNVNSATAGSKAELDAKKKQFEINKDFQLAQVAIATAKGIATAVGESPMTGGLPGSAIAAATGIAQALKISSTQFNGGGTASSSSASLPSPASSGAGGGSRQFPQSIAQLPQLKPVGAGLPQMINNNQTSNKPSTPTVVTKAIVVTSDLTKALDANAVLQRRTSF